MGRAKSSGSGASVLTRKKINPSSNSMQILVANRFLNGKEAANVMRHYETLAGIPDAAGFS